MAQSKLLYKKHHGGIMNYIIVYMTCALYTKISQSYNSFMWETGQNLKELFAQKWKCMKMYPQAIKYVVEFVSSSEKIWRNLALHQLLNNGPNNW